MNENLLTTPRLVIRRWNKAEAPILLGIRSRTEVARWMADTTPWSQIQQAHDAIFKWNTELDADSRLGTWAIAPIETGTAVGWVSLRLLPGDTHEIEIGWVLDPDATGQGYAIEAAVALLEHAKNMGLKRVWALMWPGNEPSARVARTIGMTDLGVDDDPWYGGTSHIFRWELPASSW
jgi:RimJ/RimL family protein N-acetyltransferase